MLPIPNFQHNNNKFMINKCRRPTKKTVTLCIIPIHGDTASAELFLDVNYGAGAAGVIVLITPDQD